MTDLENYENSLKVLVLGGSGQIGSEIRAYQDNINFSMTFPSSSELNLKNIKKITDYLNSHSFDIILNLAAYTAVDKAETDKKISDQINHIGPKLLAEEAQKRNIGSVKIHSLNQFTGSTQLENQIKQRLNMKRVLNLQDII